MFALAARELGYRIWIYSPDNDSPAGQIGDREFSCAYDDLNRIREFAAGVDVITFEFENVPSVTTAVAAEIVPVRPGGDVLHISQHRLREKTFLHDNGFPVTPFRRIATPEDLELAVRELGLPGVLKTASFGYDGKGQVKLTCDADIGAAVASLEASEGIYEAFVDFEREVSVIAARAMDGNVSVFPLFENRHARHILDLTFAPASVSSAIAKDACDLASAILDRLGVVGLLTVEMFVTQKGNLLVNELAPRPHNSGHLTIDVCATSQFEQQVRAICGLPLGSTEQRAPAAMANLLGDLWRPSEPNWLAALADASVKLHLYGKSQPRPGRKMGHLTGTGQTTAEALERVRRARERLIVPEAFP
jgi:5-(carboxyamino)imidazole ribonucleotide synthase